MTKDGGDAHGTAEERPAKPDAVHESLAKLENPALLVVPTTPAMTLSEACQNIVEHAGRGGWVAVQTYTWKQRLGRRVVVIAVCDAGIGFRQSLESGNSARARSDRTTIETRSIAKSTSSVAEQMKRMSSTASHQLPIGLSGLDT